MKPALLISKDGFVKVESHHDVLDKTYLEYAKMTNLEINASKFKGHVRSTEITSFLTKQTFKRVGEVRAYHIFEEI